MKNKTKKKRKFKIDRQRWARGGQEATKLCDIDGKMCCLGFAANQISRLTKNELLNHEVPEEVYSKASFLTRLVESPWGDLQTKDNELAENAIGINDNMYLTESEREKLLIELFDEHDIDVTFYN